MKFKVGDMVDIEEDCFYGRNLEISLQGWRVESVRDVLPYPYLIRTDGVDMELPMLERELYHSVVNMENE